MNYENYSCDNQMSIFDYIESPPIFKITKPVRLIETFAGVSSQSMALKRLGVDYEDWKYIEYDKYPVKSRNAIFGSNFEPMDITKIHAKDLEIVDRDKYEYVFTYSFPCQDISVAGLGKSLEKGSGTRSGLLWEVERILDECGEELPQVLLMENVKNLLSAKHKEHFDKWCEYLESKGYSNFYQVMNAKDYGVAQNRERVFMVSILGAYRYEFPEPRPLEKCMKDYLEENVDKKYYITTEKARNLIDKLVLDGKILTADSRQQTADSRQQTADSRQQTADSRQTVDLCSQHAETEEVCRCIKARYDAGITNFKHDNTGLCEIRKINK